MREIIKQIIGVSKCTRPGIKLTAVKGIVVHYTANAKANAEQNIRFWDNRGKSDGCKQGFGAAHLVVDNTETRLSVPLDELAYHVGANSYMEGITDKLSTYPNNCTIGVEMCNIDDAGNFHPDTESAAAELVAYLLKAYRLTIDDVYRHYDITGKICPKLYVENQAAYDNFKQKIASLL
jgi:N-acetylmuramoyl-L-alanine amidase